MALKVLGIDPGTAIVGWGYIEVDKSGDIDREKLEYGVVTTPAGLEMSDRLIMISEEISALLKKLKPDVVGVEQIFFHKNQKTAITVAQARGVVLLEARRKGATIVELTPLQVKEAIAGYGRADKQQMQKMLKMLLGLKKIPKPDDAADAIGVAICAAQEAQMAKKIKEAS